MREDALPPDSGLKAGGTAGALVATAIEIFGRKGFDATSTREIAAAAGTNIAAISYHFGGKAGLRLACAEAFAAHVGGLIDSLTAQDPVTAEAARALLVTLIDRLARHLIGAAEMRPFAAFALREISDGGPGTDILYTALIGPAHRRLCRLCALATGEDPEAEPVKLFVFSLIGQILYFRIGAAIVTRRMGWSDIGPDETEKIVAVLQANLSTQIAARRRFPE
ncbi:DUF1956 domain-containing protein [Rhodobacter capsulatus]|uniref:DUF1956 domain-containing protein n=1 Tax=Rhodobacter capsulatus TaxID=1061 RepID=A0A4U1K2E9_RHOCA|nr:CerR family C-terminal domain-containing protein [Rhodobacter capsulatus]TKD26143.1 DUF1956 domain-containing protein [Rhodobacter capsulatus]